jgi:hypothetical protein
MSDAISNLGGGGLSTPFLANLATSLNYAAGFIVTLAGGPLINKLGIRWSCILAAITMPLAGSGYYVNARYDVDWYLLFSRVRAYRLKHSSKPLSILADRNLTPCQILGGMFSGFLYVGETTAMLSYPDQNDRGLFLGM